jgi:hypothetical protein
MREQASAALREARMEDCDTLADMMAEFYAESSYLLNRVRARSAFSLIRPRARPSAMAAPGLLVIGCVATLLVSCHRERSVRYVVVDHGCTRSVAAEPNPVVVADSLIDASTLGAVVLEPRGPDQDTRVDGLMVWLQADPGADPGTQLAATAGRSGRAVLSGLQPGRAWAFFLLTGYHATAFEVEIRAGRERTVRFDVSAAVLCHD